ncbi:MAG: pyridoxamine 5'-phosphate oxidase, partial [Anaerolineae bacterium]
MVIDPFVSELRAFLGRHNVLTLAYQDDQGVGACAVWFAVDEQLHLHFLSSPTTRHGRALAAGAQVAFTVHKDEQNWHSIQGIQGVGLCARTPAHSIDTAWQVYTRRFPFVARQFPDLQAALESAALWRIVPAWIRLIDNTKGFGHKEERSF